MEEIQKHLAGRGDRFLAYIIDILPIILMVFGVFYFFFGFNEILEKYFSRGNNIQPRIDFLKQRNGIRDVSFFIWIIYCIFLEASNKQGTIGKQIMGIKVVDQNGNRLSMGKSIGRNLSKILSFIVLSIGFIWILFDKKKQGWHDKINQTFVVSNQHSILKTVALLVILGLSTQCSNTVERTQTLKLAHNLSVDHPVSKAMDFLSTRCAELSDNKLKIKIYPGGQLGSEQQNVELLQLGSLAMTKVSAAVLEGFAEDYKAIGLPYLFKDKKHSFDVYDSDIGRDLLLCTEKKWIRGLCFYDAGSRSFYTKEKPITQPDDLSGLKLRVMKSKTAMQMVSALGGSPTPLSWGELYTALQSGVVDGAENNPPTFYNSHHYEVCKYFSLDEHASIPDVLIMSKVVWDKLSEAEQKILEQAVKESVDKQRELWATAENEALEALKKEGVKINYPDKKPFSDKVSKMYDSFKNNPVVYGYIQRILALKEIEGGKIEAKD